MKPTSQRRDAGPTGLASEGGVFAAQGPSHTGPRVLESRSNGFCKAQGGA
jgi:hypothetical protein